MPRISNQIAMAVGAGGAMVDVSDWVEFDQGIDYAWGKQSEFRSQGPAKWSFTLDNHDGRFTPGNAAVLATPLTEGMTVSWQCGDRVVAGSILSIAPVFDGDQASWARIEITVDDMLGAAARTNIGTLVDSINEAAGQMVFFRMDGDDDAVYAADECGVLPDMAVYTLAGNTADPTQRFGQPPVPGLKDKQVAVYSVAELTYFWSIARNTNIQYPQNTLGSWGFWFTPNLTSQMSFDVAIAGLGNFISLAYTPNGMFTLFPGIGTPVRVSISAGADLYRPHYWAWTSTTTLSGGVWTINLSMYLDGALIGTTPYVTSSGPVVSLTNADRQPTEVRFVVGDGVGTMNATFGRLSHTLSLAREDLAVGNTEAERLQALDAIVPSMMLDVLPADLSQQTIGFNQPTGAVLDAINDVIKTEQGHIWSTTTPASTLLEPTQVVKVRARRRPSTVTTTFDVEDELDRAPSFVRDITNMLARVDVIGTDEERTVTDGTVSGRVGSSSASEEVLLRWPGDLEAWGQDRLIRGKNVNPRIVSVTVDAMTTPTDRSGDLLALKPGDRVQFTNLPTAQLGFPTWDGWFIGGSESHTVQEHKFTLYFQPVLDLVPARFDTAQFMSGGALYLTVAATSTATSLKVNTQGAAPSTVTPYTIQVDQEQMLVTAVAGGGGGDWSFTVTREANGTTGAAHAVNAAVELADTAETTYRVNWYPNPVHAGAGIHDGATSYTVVATSGLYTITSGWQVVNANALPAHSQFGYQYPGILVNPVSAGEPLPVSLDWINFNGMGQVRLFVNAYNAAGAVVGNLDQVGTTWGGTLSGSIVGTDTITNLTMWVFVENTTGSAFPSGSNAWFGHAVIGDPVFFYGGQAGAHWAGTVNSSPSVMGGKTARTEFVF